MAPARCALALALVAAAQALAAKGDPNDVRCSAREASGCSSAERAAVERKALCCGHAAADVKMHFLSEALRPSEESARSERSA